MPPPVAAAIVSVRDDLAKSLNVADPSTGWTPAYSLNPQLARQTADFLVFSALTTVARRPGVTWSWTENWPYEPMWCSRSAPGGEFVSTNSTET